VAAPPSSDVRIAEVRHGYEDHVYRAPYKFGGRVVDRVTILNVRCRVETRAGKSAWGFGSMTLGNRWAFPSRTMSYDMTLGAMKDLAGRIARVTEQCREVGHPLDLAHVLESEYLSAAAETSKALKLHEPMPKLCTLVVGSPFDAALHDAFGKVHGRNVYATYGTDLLRHDLSRYLGPQFAGDRLDRYLLRVPQERIPLFHSVGGLDPLVSTEWLAAHLSAPDVRVVDASHYKVEDNRDPKSEFKQRHIPGAVFFDLKEIAVLDSPYPMAMPHPV
jgi:hypothetical protein